MLKRVATLSALVGTLAIVPANAAAQDWDTCIDALMSILADNEGQTSDLILSEAGISNAPTAFPRNSDGGIDWNATVFSSRPALNRACAEGLKRTTIKAYFDDMETIVRSLNDDGVAAQAVVMNHFQQAVFQDLIEQGAQVVLPVSVTPYWNFEEELVSISYSSICGEFEVDLAPKEEA